MWTCPVCDTKTEHPLCPECGFDRSTDLTAFPTLGLPSRLPAAPSALRVDRAVLHCPGCGGTSFGFRLKSGTCYCKSCRAVLPTDLLSEFLGAVIPEPESVRPAALSAGGYHSVLLFSDGTARAAGDNSQRQCDLNGWSGLTAVAAGYSRTVGLRSDGTVVAVGYAQTPDPYYPGPYPVDYEPRPYCGIDHWTAITQISTGCSHILGLKSDGTAIVSHCGTPNQESVGAWRDLTAVSAGYWHSVGLKANGTVLSTGRNSEKQCRTTLWRGITAVAAGGFHTVGLRSNGTAVAVGDNFQGQCNVSGWSDLCAIAAGGNHTVGLRSDGRVLATGSNEAGQCLVEGWSDVVAIAAGDKHTLALRSDGAILTAGSMEYGQCNTQKLLGA